MSFHELIVLNLSILSLCLVKNWGASFSFHTFMIPQNNHKILTSWNRWVRNLVNLCWKTEEEGCSVCTLLKARQQALNLHYRYKQNQKSFWNHFLTFFFMMCILSDLFLCCLYSQGYFPCHTKNYNLYRVKAHARFIPRHFGRFFIAEKILLANSIEHTW